MFREAGIGPGQRVLDIGSGVGDVALLAARLVGPSGKVVGIERDPRSLARARARAAEAGARHIEYVQGDVSEIQDDKWFDAIIPPDAPPLPRGFTYLEMKKEGGE